MNRMARPPLPNPIDLLIGIYSTIMAGLSIGGSLHPVEPLWIVLSAAIALWGGTVLEPLLEVARLLPSLAGRTPGRKDTR